MITIENIDLMEQTMNGMGGLWFILFIISGLAVHLSNDIKTVWITGTALIIFGALSIYSLL